MSAPVTPTEHITGTGLTPLHESAPHIVVFTKPNCTHCRFVINTLKKADVPRITADITEIRDTLVDAGITEAPLVIMHNVLDTDGNPVTHHEQTPVSVAFSGAGVDRLLTVRKNWPDIVESLTDDHTRWITDDTQINHDGEPVTVDDLLTQITMFSSESGQKTPPESELTIPWQLN